jgi:hypothetical protein
MTLIRVSMTKVQKVPLWGSSAVSRELPSTAGTGQVERLPQPEGNGGYVIGQPPLPKARSRRDAPDCGIPHLKSRSAGVGAVGFARGQR